MNYFVFPSRHLHAIIMVKIAVIYSFSGALNIAHTLSEINDTYFEWDIEKFFDLPTEDDYFLDSPQILFADTKWYLTIYTNGSTVDQSRGFIGIYISFVEPEVVHHIRYTLGIKNPDGSIFVQNESDGIISESNSSGWSEMLKRSSLLNSKDIVAPQDTLTVFFKAAILDKEPLVPFISAGIGSFSADFKDLYNSKRFSDVKLIVKGREFAAHKSVLSCRLNSFGSMLENIPDKVEITDCDPDSFNEFLLFVYTGGLLLSSYEKTKSLYLTADKYNLTDLKKECARSIIKYDLNERSLYDILEFENLHNDDMLLTGAIDFLIKNAKRILPTEKWQKYLISDPLQVNKLFLRHLDFIVDAN